MLYFLLALVLINLIISIYSFLKIDKKLKIVDYYLNDLINDEILKENEKLPSIDFENSADYNQ